MTNANITRTEDDREIKLSRDLDILDEKGRKVGGYATIGKVPAVRRAWVTKRAPDGTYLQTVCETGDTLGYAVEIYATRNGKAYGASPPTKHHRTPELALAAAEKGLAAQAKRYARKYAK